MTEQKFRDKYAGKVVHCDTEEKAKELLALAHTFGWSWNSGRNLSEITYWRDLQDGTCYHLNNNKTVGYARLDYYKSEDYEIVEFESEEKKVKARNTKKVFDLGLFVDGLRSEGISDEQIIDSIMIWALDCHGLTVEEMNEKDYSTSYSWMKEVEVDIQLTEHEIEVLKALKVLGLEWIARDSDLKLYAYDSKPTKTISSHSAPDHWFYLKGDLFKFITWEDEEPSNIDELLEYTKNTEGEQK